MAQRTYNCPVDMCGKIFVSFQSFKEHRKEHGMETYACDVPTCQRRFKWRSSLASHKRSHGVKRRLTAGLREPKSQPLDQRLTDMYLQTLEDIIDTDASMSCVTDSVCTSAATIRVGSSTSRADMRADSSACKLNFIDECIGANDDLDSFFHVQKPIMEESSIDTFAQHSLPIEFLRAISPPAEADFLESFF